MPYLPGEPAADADSLDLADAAGSVGGFLGSLHAPAPPDAPANPFRGVPLADRADSVAANLRLLSNRVDRDAVQRAWSAALAAPGLLRARRAGCTATCTRPTSWSATAGSAA